MKSFFCGQWVVPAAFCLVLPCSVARAVVPPERAQLPNFDLRRQSLRATAGSPDQQAAAASLRARLPQTRVDFDLVTGAPKRISAIGQFLTGARGEGKTVSAAALAGLAADDPHRAVKGFLREHRRLFGHGPEALDAARFKREFAAPHSGMKTVVWEQQVDGIPLFEAVLIAHTTARGELVTLSSQFLPDPPAAANRGTPKRAALAAGPAISAQQAVAISARNLGETLDEKDVLPDPEAADLSSAEKRQAFRSAALKGSAEARLIWLPVGPDRLRLCWDVILMSRSRGEMFRLLVDAETGEPWLRHGLTDYLSEASYRVYTSDSPTPFSPGHPTPLTNQPPLLARTLVTISALDTNASPNGWLDDGANETLGNNVDAHTDRNNDDLPDLPRPQGSPFRVFDFEMDSSSQDPTNYSAAAVTQLFYWCNWMHDKLYELGFTEAAGNFQSNNFGRGGLGNDAVLADAQDGGDVNNANFSTPPDGSAGRMQMYLFSRPGPRRDGDLDAEVVLHEYTHGLSDRRVGGGVGISALQARGLGEGWSDFYALALLSEAGDDMHGNYAFAAYVSKDLSGLRENYFFGIRRYPYSTELAKNPLTFKDIDPTQISSHFGIPASPVAGSGGAGEVHNQGEVWCVTLWEARANLINKYGWAAGNQLILQLVTDGMNLSPPNPDFLQARDAILQADQVLTGGTNQNELWTAFAKRGLGFQAVAPVSSTTTGVIEDFSLPDDLRITPSAAVIFRGPVGGPFLPLVRSYTLTNAGGAPLNWSVQAGPQFELSGASGGLAPGEATTVTVSASAAAAALPAGIYSDSLTFSNTTSGATQSRSVTLRIGQPDFFTENFSAGDFDLAFTTLTFTPDGSTNFYRVCREPAAVFPTEPAGGTPVTLGDDTYLFTALAGGATVSIYGQSGGSFYIGANGHLTLSAGHTNFFYPELAVYFERERVSALYTDLNPGAAGSVSWQQLSNRVAVTYLAVPEFGVTNTNSFQMELFFNGVIRVTWLEIDAVNAVVGLSRGPSQPAGFVESDLSLSPACSIQPPQLRLDRAGEDLQFTWLPDLTAFRLESAGNLQPPVAWEDVTNAVIFTNGFNTVRLPPTNSPRFFRLVAP